MASRTVLDVQAATTASPRGVGEWKGLRIIPVATSIS
jgi:hypothetical protein